MRALSSMQLVETGRAREKTKIKRVFTHPHKYKYMQVCTHVRVTQCNHHLSNLLHQHCASWATPKMWRNINLGKNLSEISAALFTYKHLQASDYMWHAPVVILMHECVCVCMFVCTNMCTRSSSRRILYTLTQCLKSNTKNENKHWYKKDTFTKCC